MSALDTFEKMLAQGRDNALLRYSLGNEYLKLGRLEEAARHLQAAVGFDPHYSAAWKLLGRALAEQGRAEEALETYQKGVAAAEAKGDIQAAKEMGVFRTRAQQALEAKDLASD